MPDVVLKQLDKTYPNGVHAVDSLSLAVNDGEFVAIVGPSGCGKSTTLRLIAGLEEPSGGEIFIGQRLVNRVPPADRGIAMVFQNAALYPHLTVRENLAFALKICRMQRAEIEARIREAGASLDVERLLDRLPRELSGGECQRIALGRAIVRAPQVLLLDEPLSNIDAPFRVQLRAEIARLHRRLETTTVYVTHDQSEAMTLGDRIVVIDHGVVQQVDTPLEIYQRPANRFVASFIGSPGMNFIAGEFRAGVFRATNSGATRSGGRPNLDTDERKEPGTEFTLELDRRFADGPAVLGIRPEHFTTSSNGTPIGAVSLTWVEYVGHETLAHFMLAGCPQVARLPAGVNVRSGDQLPLGIVASACHYFSTADGRRLNYR